MQQTAPAVLLITAALIQPHLLVVHPRPVVVRVPVLRLARAAEQVEVGANSHVERVVWQLAQIRNAVMKHKFCFFVSSSYNLSLSKNILVTYKTLYFTLFNTRKNLVTIILKNFKVILAYLLLKFYKSY